MQRLFVNLDASVKITVVQKYSTSSVGRYYTAVKIKSNIMHKNDLYLYKADLGHAKVESEFLPMSKRKSARPNRGAGGLILTPLPGRSLWEVSTLFCNLTCLAYRFPFLENLSSLPLHTSRPMPKRQVTNGPYPG